MITGYMSCNEDKFGRIYVENKRVVRNLTIWGWTEE